MEDWDEVKKKNPVQQFLPFLIIDVIHIDCRKFGKNTD